MLDQKTIFSNLKKCNQIGKKLSSDGIYIFVSGMMIGYDDLPLDATEANSLSISFIESKILEKMDAIPYIGIIIDGNKLYQMASEFDFDRISIDSQYLNIEFIGYETSDSQVIDDFRAAAKEKGLKITDDLLVDYPNSLKNNLDVYEFYIQYNKIPKENKTNKVIKYLKCPIISEDNKLLNKANKIIDKLTTKYTFLGYKELQPEIFDIIMNATQPIDVKVNTSIGEYTLRIMKSLFINASTKSSCELRLFRGKNVDYLIIEITNSGFITCSIYKVVKFE